MCAQKWLIANGGLNQTLFHPLYPKGNWCDICYKYSRTVVEAYVATRHLSELVISQFVPASKLWQFLAYALDFDVWEYKHDGKLA